MQFAQIQATTPQAIKVADVSTANTSKMIETAPCPVKPDADSLRYAQSVARALNSDFGKFSACRYVAVTLEGGDPIDGDASYRLLEDRLAESELYGKNYRSKITIIGPRRG